MSEGLTVKKMLSRQIDSESKLFTFELGLVSEVINRAAADPESVIGTADLTRVASQVSDLVRRASRIDAMREVVKVMEE